MGARIPAARTWQLIRQMVPEFDGEKGLAFRLGVRDGQLRYGRHVITVATAAKVWTLYYGTMVEDVRQPDEVIAWAEVLSPGAEQNSR